MKDDKLGKLYQVNLTGLPKHKDIVSVTMGRNSAFFYLRQLLEQIEKNEKIIVIEFDCEMFVSEFDSDE